MGGSQVAIALALFGAVVGLLILTDIASSLRTLCRRLAPPHTWDEKWHDLGREALAQDTPDWPCGRCGETHHAWLPCVSADNPSTDGAP